MVGMVENSGNVVPGNMQQRTMGEWENKYMQDNEGRVTGENTAEGNAPNESEGGGNLETRHRKQLLSK